MVGNGNTHEKPPVLVVVQLSGGNDFMNTIIPYTAGVSHDNRPTVSIRQDKVLPIDLLRAKLAIFGATHFDPRSDRWVRINMFQHAPLPFEFDQSDADNWTLPELKEDKA